MEPAYGALRKSIFPGVPPFINFVPIGGFTGKIDFDLCFPPLMQRKRSEKIQKKKLGKKFRKKLGKNKTKFR